MPDFGIGEALAGVLTGVGVGAETAGAIAPIAAGGLEGAALGAGTAGITGGNPLTGALTGGITGGAIPALGPAIGEATGFGTTAGDVLAGAGAGTVGSLITGGNPVVGGLGGAAGGAFAGLTGGSSAPSTGSTSVTGLPSTGAGGGTSAASTSSVAPTGGPAMDLTGGGPLGDTSTMATFGLSPSTSAFGTSGPGYTGGGPGTPPQFGGDSIGGPATPSDFGGGTPGIGSKLLGYVQNNPASALGIAGLGASLLMGPQPLPSAGTALQEQAGEAATMGRTLASYQLSGTLPSGLQSVVDQQFEAAKAGVVSQYAQLGLGNSTMLADKLNELKQQKSAEIAQMADNLAKQGINWQNLSAEEFGKVLTAQQQNDTQFQNAIAGFAKGLAGMPLGTTTGGGGGSSGTAA